jgi:dTDP-6-deoxy-L-talose 4-dehydrogenase (NAD+)
MTKTILLTGASGFVGRSILSSLIDLGLKIKIIVRNDDNRLSPFIPHIAEIYYTDDLFSETGDRLYEFCKGVDIVIHAAWYAEPGKYLESPLNQTCLYGTEVLALAAIRAGISKFVGIGTCFEYDLSEAMQSISTPLKPISFYAKCKVNTYIRLDQIFSEANLSFSWCRIFYLYGESEDSRRLTPFVRQNLIDGELVNLGSGDAVRDFLDVRIAGQMIVEIATQENCVGAFNICSGLPITIKEYCEKIAREFGRVDLLRFGVSDIDEKSPVSVVGVPNYTLVEMRNYEGTT